MSRPERVQWGELRKFMNKLSLKQPASHFFLKNTKLYIDNRQSYKTFITIITVDNRQSHKTFLIIDKKDNTGLFSDCTTGMLRKELCRNTILFSCPPPTTFSYPR